MYQFFGVVFIIIGFLTIINGVLTPTETSIHQIYAQLIILSGTICFIGGFLLSNMSSILDRQKDLFYKINDLKNEIKKA